MLIITSFKTLWAEWNIRFAVLFSLFLQILLILLSPFRRRTSHKALILGIWFAYLVADMAATFAIGLISKVHITNNIDNTSIIESEFLSLWAPFLLVHLGGPDTITAFALEDNQLWVRHFLSFAVQAFYTVYFFLLSFVHNKLRIPTFLMFLAGVIKYLERTRSLYLASKNKFRDAMTRDPDPGIDYDKAVKIADHQKPSDQQPSHSGDDQRQQPLIERARRERDHQDEVQVEVAIVKRGYRNFKMVKGLLADLILGFDVRNFSRKFFFEDNASAEAALRVLEVELSFAYEVLYTKAVVVQSREGRIARLIAILSVVLALLVFHFHGKPHGEFNYDVDVVVTYVLLCGALALDGLSLLMSTLSDWVVVAFLEQDEEDHKKKNKICSWWRRHVLARFYEMAMKFYVQVFLLKSNIVMKQKEEGSKMTNLERPLLYRRWCRSVSGFNLMTFCLRKQCRFGLGVQSLLDELRFKTTKPLTLELWEFIFTELKSKSESKFINSCDAESLRKRCYARGEVVMERTHMDKGRLDLRPYVVDVPYDQSLLLWHIATELLYNVPAKTRSSSSSQEDQSTILEKELSKTMSDYMLYLVIMQPTMMATVSGIGKIRFEDTCAEARRFFTRRGVGRNEVRNACKRIMDVKTEVQPTTIKGRSSTTVLFTASMLAKALQHVDGEKNMWKNIGRMWVELLSYAAINCEKTAHSSQVSKGGELLTYVWLMMTHFGLSMQFQENATSLLQV